MAVNVDMDGDNTGYIGLEFDSDRWNAFQLDPEVFQLGNTAFNSQYIQLAKKAFCSEF